MAKMSYKSGLPDAIATKIYKTGQTRGAEPDTIYQNRVLRNSTVLIPFSAWNDGKIVPEHGFEKGYIVLVTPEEYFSDKPPKQKDGFPDGLKLGENLLVIYETRAEWNKYNPNTFGWQCATSRNSPLNGEYVARVPDTTNEDDEKIREGFTTKQTGGQGAGIRVYEYASTTVLQLTRYQLAYLAWRTEGIFELSKMNGIGEPEVFKKHVDDICEEYTLADTRILEEKRLIKNGRTVCPLCLKPISAIELASRVEQAEGRFVPDLTVTNVNLFHVDELRTGVYNHNLYNLGWGHHHCNTVARDYGITNTLNWMADVLKRNGLLIDEKITI